MLPPYPWDNGPEPYRIPGDALELMKYKLEEAQARIEELEQDLKDCMAYMYDERIKELEAAQAESERLRQKLDEVTYVRFRGDPEALEKAQARIKELEQEVEHYSQMAFNLGVKCGGLEQDRDNWRAKAEQ